MRPLIKSDWLQSVISLIHFFMIYDLVLIFIITMSDGAFVLLKWTLYACISFMLHHSVTKLNYANSSLSVESVH